MWQQDPEELAQAVTACLGISMLLQGGATLEFPDAQLLGAQTDPKIGAAISRRVPTIQVTFRQETRLCVSSAIHFYSQINLHVELPHTDRL